MTEPRTLFEQINVIFEDPNVLVIDKPAGLVVNISQTSPSHTLQNYLIDTHGFNYDPLSEDEFVKRTGIIHRLDKDTSGVLIIGKNPETFFFIQSQFKKREVEKEYIAVVHGRFDYPLVSVDAPLKRDRKNRLKYAISREGKSAYTEFELLNTKKYENHWVSVVKCRPRTGRTHQIRVHLCGLSHSVVGDVIYSGKRQLKWAHVELGINRMLLHAQSLGVKLTPEAQDTKQFLAAIPKDFNAFVDK